jgi:hypothetical protein
MQLRTRSTLISSASTMTWTATITGAFVRREDHSKITSASYLTVDQGTACAALTTPERRPRSCPTLSSHWHRAPTTGRKISLETTQDEIFMTQNIRTSNGRETIRTNRLGPADDQDVRHFISSMMLTDAGHGDVLGLQRKGNALLLWVNWTRYSGNAWSRDLVRFQWGRNCPPVRQLSRSCQSTALCRLCKPSSIPPGPTCLSHQWQRARSL